MSVGVTVREISEEIDESALTVVVANVVVVVEVVIDALGAATVVTEITLVAVIGLDLAWFVAID